MTGRETEQAHVLSIGSVIGGRTTTNRPWIDEINRLAVEVIVARVGMETEINLNVVFHLSGNLLQPDFEGVRTGSFRSAQNLLMVQVALAESAPADPRTELLSKIGQAADEAHAWANRRQLAFDPEPVQRICSLLANS